MEICQCGARTRPAVRNGIEYSLCKSCGKDFYRNQEDLDNAMGAKVINIQPTTGDNILQREITTVVEPTI